MCVCVYVHIYQHECDTHKNTHRANGPLKELGKYRARKSFVIVSFNAPSYKEANWLKMEVSRVQAL